eukprot:9027103-Heterocapsa_arctica.AAC.1
MLIFDFDFDFDNSNSNSSSSSTTSSDSWQSDFSGSASWRRAPWARPPPSGRARSPGSSRSLRA